MRRISIFIILGLLLAAGTVALYILAAFGYQTGPEGIFTMLLGGLLLLLGFNERTETSR